MSHITIHEIEYQNMIRMVHDLQAKNYALKSSIEKRRETLLFYEDRCAIEDFVRDYLGESARAALKEDDGEV